MISIINRTAKQVGLEVVCLSEGRKAYNEAIVKGKTPHEAEYESSKAAFLFKEKVFARERVKELKKLERDGVNIPSAFFDRPLIKNQFQVALKLWRSIEFYSQLSDSSYTGKIKRAFSPVIWKNIYALVENNTEVMRRLQELRNRMEENGDFEGKVRIAHLGNTTDYTPMSTSSVLVLDDAPLQEMFIQYLDVASQAKDLGFNNSLVGQTGFCAYIFLHELGHIQYRKKESPEDFISKVCKDQKIEQDDLLWKVLNEGIKKEDVALFNECVADVWAILNIKKQTDTNGHFLGVNEDLLLSWIGEFRKSAESEDGIHKTLAAVSLGSLFEAEQIKQLLPEEIMAMTKKVATWGFVLKKLEDEKEKANYAKEAIEDLHIRTLFGFHDWKDAWEAREAELSLGIAQTEQAKHSTHKL